jgi:hypothetical protein
MTENTILKAFKPDAVTKKTAALGPVGSIAWQYVSSPSAPSPNHAKRLLGFVLKLTYNDVTIITCDPWKNLCGGVPRNSFVIIRLSEHQISADELPFSDRLILARITDSVPTPVDSEITQTIYQIHKAQANIDPVTNKELQWSALKASVIGTFFDRIGESAPEIAFGPDIDTFFAPHTYEVFVPTTDHLDRLINCFSEALDPLEIGTLRYTETPTLSSEAPVPVRVDPTDFIGKSYGHRTALFGKTRFGKSNTMKVVADVIAGSAQSAGQVIFDPSGEYTYWNEQDGGSLFARHHAHCVRYSLSPQTKEHEATLGYAPPQTLRINFFEQPDVGHGLICELWNTEFNNTPDYISPALNWECLALSNCPSKDDDISGYNHFWRTMAIWYAILIEAGYAPKAGATVPIELPGLVKKALLEDENLLDALKTTTNAKGEPTLTSFQPVNVLPALFRKVYAIWEENKEKKSWFPPSKSTGGPYYDVTQVGMLKILSGTIGTGAPKFARFSKYHSAYGSNVAKDIFEAALAGKTVLVDLALGDENVRRSLVKHICQVILRGMMRLFSRNELGGRFIVLYFEEAHTLFPRDDRSVGDDVYNRIAKEGAKFNISMVYATQSMSTLSPDLLKNTENFIVTHLDDDREVRELEHKRAFRDVAADVERIMSKGYVRMKTLSTPFALPVQIRKFDGAPSKTT